MTMSLFAQLAAELSQSKNVSSLIVGQPFLGEGTHQVTITSVDLNDAADNKIGFTFADQEGHVFNDRAFLMSINQKTGANEMSYGFRLILSGVLPGTTSLQKFVNAAATNDKIVEAFTGMKLAITLAPGKGVVARTVPGVEGAYAGYDQETGEKVTEDHASTKSVFDEIKARALKRSYLRITGSTATHKEENAAAFDNAVASLASLKPAMKQAKAF